MRTNIVLDESLIEQGFALTSAKTKRELVHLALQTLVKTRQNTKKTTIANAFDSLRQLNDYQETPFPEVSRHNRANPFADDN